MNDNHKRRILTSLQYVDKLLQENLHALAPGAQPLFGGFVQDLTPAQTRLVEGYTRKIRSQMAKLIHRCGVDYPAPSAMVSGKLRTGVTSLDLTLEDIYPEKMRGYGKMDPAAAQSLASTLNEMRGMVGRLLALLYDPQDPVPEPLPLLDAAPGLAGSIRMMGRMIADYGLVEFLPAIRALSADSQPPVAEIVVLGKRGAGKSSLINRLVGKPLLPVNAPPLFPVRITAGQDDSLTIIFPEKTEKISIGRLAEYLTDAGNPDNSRRVLGLEMTARSREFFQEISFIDTPAIGPGMGKEAGLPFLLPPGDLAFVLVEPKSELAQEEWNILEALRSRSTTVVVAIGKIDRIPPANVERIASEIRGQIARHFGSEWPVIAISSHDSQSSSLESAWKTKIAPLIAQARELRIRTIAAKAAALRKGLIWELQPRPAVDPECERIMLRIDEEIAAFRSSWEHRIRDTSVWEKEVLDLTTSALGQDGPEQDFFHAILRVANHRGLCFCNEYLQCCAKLKGSLEVLARMLPGHLFADREFPYPAGLPQPLPSFFAGIRLRPVDSRSQGVSLRTRHFRAELHERCGSQLLKMLHELQPRFERWMTDILHRLQESIRSLTDPLRYAEPADQLPELAEKRMADMEALQKSE